MSNIIIQIDAYQFTIKISMILAAIVLFLIVAIIFYFFEKDKISYMLEKEEEKKEDKNNRFNGLNRKQIDFYFDFCQKNYNDTLAQRNDENATILSHVAIIVAIASLFGILIKWSHHYCPEPVFLPFLMVVFMGAFINLFLSIWSLYLSLSLTYELPTRLGDLNARFFKRSVYDVKRIFAERMTRATKQNSDSNLRKMYLLDYSRSFQKIALLFLASIFLFICGKECFSILDINL